MHARVDDTRVKISRDFKKNVYSAAPKQYLKYDSIGPYYIPLFGHIYWKRLESVIELAKRYAPKKHLVICDLGCGFGILSVLLNLNFEATVVAVDQRSHFFTIANELSKVYANKPTYFLTNDLQDLAIQDDTFDLCFCLDVLEHVDNVAAALQEMGRVMKASGYAIITVPIEARALRYLREIYTFRGKNAQNNPHWRGVITNIRDFEALLASHFNILLKQSVPNRVAAYDMLYVCDTE
jgi:ubiquinone/menaquinone biosynthesis C-methylase UbiE